MKSYFDEFMESGEEENVILEEIKTKKQKNRERDLKDLLSKNKLNKFELEEFMLE